MNRSDLEHALDLYDQIAAIDLKAAKICGPWVEARISLHQSAMDPSLATIEVPHDSEFAPTLRAMLLKQMRALRELRASGLRRLGFEVPAEPGIESKKNLQPVCDVVGAKCTSDDCRQANSCLAAAKS